MGTNPTAIAAPALVVLGHRLVRAFAKP